MSLFEIASADLIIRNAIDHEMPDFGDPAVFDPVWNFFVTHPLP
jgi:hypothetical protein